MIRINQIKLNINETMHDGLEEKNLNKKIRRLLKLKDNVSFEFEIVKKSVDARKKEQLMYIYSVNVTVKNTGEKEIIKKLHDNNIMLINEEKYVFPQVNSDINKRIIIVGSGPAGLFCGLFLARAGFKPVIFERGANVHERTAIVNAFWETGELNVDTNVQFGEGGAGTFSDGKLNTVVKEKAGRIRKVLETFVEFGAPKAILYDAKPHVGTDILQNVVYNIRNEIEKLGGRVYFNSKMTDFYVSNGRIRGIQVNNSDEYECDSLVLALGHSARDTFELLRNKGLAMETKAFAVGMRIEHPQSLINNFAYGRDAAEPLLVPSYKVTAKAENGRGVYSFCMCPGGYVVNASSEQGRTCVNGMSYSKRDGVNANSAIIVTISPEDYYENDALDGMKFQRGLEEKAFNIGKGAVPYQLNDDFCTGKSSVSYGSVVPQIKGKCTPGNLREIFPEFLCESVIDGMKSFDKMVKGFNMPDAVFSGVESRTSSPVRMTRNENMQSVTAKGIYPCGEGAGYAGGITSAAVDGIKTAEAIAELI